MRNRSSQGGEAHNGGISATKDHGRPGGSAATVEQFLRGKAHEIAAGVKDGASKAFASTAETIRANYGHRRAKGAIATASNPSYWSGQQKEFTSPCDCGTVTTSIGTPSQCSMCGITYRVVKTRAGFSLSRAKANYTISSSSKVALTTSATVGTIFIGVGAGILSSSTVGDLGSTVVAALVILVLGLWSAVFALRLASVHLYNYYIEGSHEYASNEIELEPGAERIRVQVAMKKELQSEGSDDAEHSLSCKQEAKWLVSRAAQTPSEWKSSSNIGNQTIVKVSDMQALDDWVQQAHVRLQAMDAVVTPYSNGTPPQTPGSHTSAMGLNLKTQSPQRPRSASTTRQGHSWDFQQGPQASSYRSTSGASTPTGQIRKRPSLAASSPVHSEASGIELEDLMAESFASETLPSVQRSKSDGDSSVNSNAKVRRRSSPIDLKQPPDTHKKSSLRVDVEHLSTGPETNVLSAKGTVSPHISREHEMQSGVEVETRSASPNVMQSARKVSLGASRPSSASSFKRSSLASIKEGDHVEEPISQTGMASLQTLNKDTSNMSNAVSRSHAMSDHVAASDTGEDGQHRQDTWGAIRGFEAFDDDSAIDQFAGNSSPRQSAISGSYVSTLTPESKEMLLSAQANAASRKSFGHSIAKTNDKSDILMNGHDVQHSKKPKGLNFMRPTDPEHDDKQHGSSRGVSSSCDDTKGMLGHSTNSEIHGRQVIGHHLPGQSQDSGSMDVMETAVPDEGESMIFDDGSDDEVQGFDTQAITEMRQRGTSARSKVPRAPSAPSFPVSSGSVGSELNSAKMDSSASLPGQNDQFDAFRRPSSAVSAAEAALNPPLPPSSKQRASDDSVNDMPHGRRSSLIRPSTASDIRSSRRSS